MRLLRGLEGQWEGGWEGGITSATFQGNREGVRGTVNQMLDQLNTNPLRDGGWGVNWAAQIANIIRYHAIFNYLGTTAPGQGIHASR